MTDAPGVLSPLDEAGINAAVEEALAAFAAAGTLAELKEARLAHTGDASPLTLANRLIGTLDKADKPTAGRLLGGARGRIAKALTARQETLEAAADGATVSEVARRVHLSEGTTRNHLSQAMAKTDAPTRAAAVHIAAQKGWIIE